MVKKSTLNIDLAPQLHPCRVLHHRARHLGLISRAHVAVIELLYEHIAKLLRHRTHLRAIGQPNGGQCRGDITAQQVVHCITHLLPNFEVPLPSFLSRVLQILRKQHPSQVHDAALKFKRLFLFQAARLRDDEARTKLR